MSQRNKGWSGRKTLLVLLSLFGLPLGVLWALGQVEMLKALGVFLLVAVGGCGLLLLIAVGVRKRIGVDWDEFWRDSIWKFWRFRR